MLFAICRICFLECVWTFVGFDLTWLMGKLMRVRDMVVLLPSEQARKRAMQSGSMSSRKGRGPSNSLAFTARHYCWYLGSAEHPAVAGRGLRHLASDLGCSKGSPCRCALHLPRFTP